MCVCVFVFVYIPKFFVYASIHLKRVAQSLERACIVENIDYRVETCAIGLVCVIYGSAPYNVKRRDSTEVS